MTRMDNTVLGRGWILVLWIILATNGKKTATNDFSKKINKTSFL